jgi:pimeloyl-ACP methyl ester carboxylesterase
MGGRHWLVGLISPLLALGLATSVAFGQGQPPGKAQPPGKVQPAIKRPPGFQPKAPGFQPKAPGFQPKTAPPPAAASPAKKPGPKLPDPEEVSLETRDGMTIKATYYPGTAKKEAAAVIMIHGLEGQRGDYHSLAVSLQGLGHASIAPDLRGHGQSKVQKRPDGTPVTLEAEKLNKATLEDMIYDVQACKKFLMEKNNAGELNIEQLCVIGADLGAILAVRFAAYDWSLQDLPAYKQGKDVKAVVLLSPVASVKGLTLREGLAHPAVQSQISMMFVAGLKDTKSAGEAKKLNNSLQGHRPKLPEDKEDRLKSQDLFLIQPDVSLSGTKLLTSGTSVPRDIALFIDLRLVNRKAEFAWQDRTNPLDN